MKSAPYSFAFISPSSSVTCLSATKSDLFPIIIIGTSLFSISLINLIQSSILSNELLLVISYTTKIPFAPLRNCLVRGLKLSSPDVSHISALNKRPFNLNDLLSYEHPFVALYFSPTKIFLINCQLY